jgi:hypothetical protein
LPVIGGRIFLYVVLYPHKEIFRPYGTLWSFFLVYYKYFVPNGTSEDCKLACNYRKNIYCGRLKYEHFGCITFVAFFAFPHPPSAVGFASTSWPPLTGEGWDRGPEICDICDYHNC